VYNANIKCILVHGLVLFCFTCTLIIIELNLNPLAAQGIYDMIL
jgi:hypothetical protein